MAPTEPIARGDTGHGIDQRGNEAPVKQHQLNQTAHSRFMDELQSLLPDIDPEGMLKRTTNPAKYLSLVTSAATFSTGYAKHSCSALG